MRTRKYLLWILLLTGTVSVVQAQSWKREKADKYYEEFAYSKAIPLYETLKEKDAEVYRRLADSYYHLGEYSKAANIYDEFISQGGYDPEDLYKYAYYLQMTGDYSKAKQYMERYARLKPGDSRVKRFLSNPDYYSKLKEPDPQVSLKNVSVNSKNSDFGPSYYVDSNVVFTSGRGWGRVWNGNLQHYLDLYKADITGDNDLQNAEKFFGEINKKYHDGPAAFSADGKIMVVTRNVYNKQLKDNRLWLYESRKGEDGMWSNPEPLPFNGDNYSCGHATLSADGNVMYFASDMPGGYGQSDIYLVRRGADGQWGKPENLGNVINTEGNEMFPFYDEEGGYLFFAGDGHPGLGGLDVFVSKIGQGQYSEPVNLGAPVNTAHDDFGLIYKDNGSNGYLSSNRPGGKGDDDIYGFSGLNRFKQQAVFYTLTGVVKDKDSGEPVSGAKVVLKDAQGKHIGEVTTGANGLYKFTDLSDPLGYVVSASKEDYDGGSGQVQRGDMVDPVITKNLFLQAQKPAGPVTAADYCSTQISPLYYDLDKYFIRDTYKPKLDSIVAVMKAHPELRLYIGSHTDSRASKSYNIRLSKNRAMSVVKYLTKAGISKDRLDVHWYGESRPVNGCVDGVECTEEQYQLNRRTEFKWLCPKEEN